MAGHGYESNEEEASGRTDMSHTCCQKAAVNLTDQAGQKGTQAVRTH